MFNSSENRIDRLLCATLYAAAGLTLFACAVQPFLPHGDVPKAVSMVLLSKQSLALPEPDESLRHILLCLAAVPAAFFSWHLTEKHTLRLPDAAGLLLIPLWCLTGWSGTSSLITLPAGALLTVAALKFYRRERRKKSAAWPMNTALVLLCVFIFARRFPLPGELENPFGDHMNIVLYALNAAVHRMPDIHLYGFYPAFLAPFFRMAGLSLLSAELVMNCLYLAAFALTADAARRLIRHDLLLSGFLVTAALTCGNAAYLTAGGNIFDPYFAYWPVRFLFPALALNLVSRRDLRGFPLWSGILSAAALWFNPDSGLAVAGALFAVLLFSGQFRATGVWLVTFLTALPGWAFLLYAANGFMPDYRGYLAYMQDFWQAGYMMLPIEGAPIWLFPGLILTCGLVWSLKSLPVKAESRPVLFLAVLGAGLFNYYIGRSHPSNLITCSWPALLLLFLFADRIRPRRKITYCVILFLGMTSVSLVMLRIPRIIPECNRMIRQFYIPSLSSYKVLSIRKLAGDMQTVNIMPRIQQGHFYAETGLKPGIANFGMSELIFLKDRKRIMDQLKVSNVPLIITMDLQLAPPLQEHYQLAKTDEELKIRLYLPVSRREAPAPRPPAAP